MSPRCVLDGQTISTPFLQQFMLIFSQKNANLTASLLVLNLAILARQYFAGFIFAVLTSIKYAKKALNFAILAFSTSLSFLKKSEPLRKLDKPEQTIGEIFAN